jgi:two-component system, cell cycle response regulator DivK
MASNQRVLVAEDNDLNYQLVSFVLGKLELDVERASSGAEALELASAERFDLVLMDIQLPDVDGLEVTRRLRANPETAGMPIVAVTALAMAGDEQKALAAGCDAYLTKPVSPAHLMETARRFLDPGAGTQA